jgi:ketosteroid isomerase-like protein
LLGVLILAAGAAAVVAVMANSGSRGGDGDIAKVKQTLTREMMAVAAGDSATACSLATPAGQARLARAVSGGSCEEVITLVAKHLPPALKAGLESAKVNRVTISGDTATVQDSDITSTRGSLAGFLQPGSAPTVFQKQPDGSWKIAR